MEPLKIYKTATAIYFSCNHDGVLPNGISLKYHMRTFYEYKYDKLLDKFVPAYKYFYYDRGNKLLYIPVAFLPDLLNWIGNNPYEIIEIPPIPGFAAEFKLAEGIYIRDYQQDLINFLSNPESRFKALDARTGCGKALTHNSRIKIPGGWTTMGEITVGDTVITPDGTTAKVVEKHYQGIKKIWRVVFEDGRYVNCDREHLWAVYITDTTYNFTYEKYNDRIVVETWYLYELLRNGYSVYIDTVQGELESVEPHKPFTTPPYVFGTFIAEESDIDIDEFSLYLYGSYTQRIDILKGIFRIPHSEPLPNTIPFSLNNEKIESLVIELIWSIGGKLNTIVHNNDVKIHIATFPTQSTRVKLKMTQVIIIDILEPCSCIKIDHPNHLFITDNYIITHNTFCAITSASKIGLNTLILTSGLIKQWWKELLAKSTLTKQDIWVIQGADSLKKLLSTEGKYIPKVIIASTRTWFMYATRQKEPYTEFIKYEDFLKLYGIGTKIIDEAHMNFHANLTIDLLTNVQHHIYLSATYERNNKDGARIFNKIFHNDVKYGSHLAKKYTKAYVIGYKLGRELPLKAYTTKEGYNHALFEIAIGRDKNLRYTFLNQTVDRAINEFFIPYRKPGQRCLFICMTTGTMKSIVRHINYKYPQFKVCDFSGDDPDDKITPDIDIIVSTIKKSGTGRDIKNLKICVNLVSYKSPPLIKQVFGRLRELPNEETIFLDFYCREIEHHRNHVEVRHSRYLDIATKVEIW